MEGLEGWLCFVIVMSVIPEDWPVNVKINSLFVVTELVTCAYALLDPAV